jgi:hypothetical protein
MTKQQHVTIVPAQPGFSVTEVCDGLNDDEHELYHIPVVAWVITIITENGTPTRDPWLFPVTVESRSSTSYCAIRCPDGQTIVQEDRRFPAGDNDKLLAYLVERNCVDRGEGKAQRAQTVKLTPRPR